MQLFNARVEMEFEIKDKKAEIAELKQDIADYDFQLKDIRAYSVKLENEAIENKKEISELKL